MRHKKCHSNIQNITTIDTMNKIQEYYYLNLYTIIFGEVKNPISRIKSFQQYKMLPNKQLTKEAREYIHQKDIYQFMNWLYDNDIPENMWCINCKNCKYCIFCCDCNDCMGISFSKTSANCSFSVQLFSCYECMFCKNCKDSEYLELNNNDIIYCVGLNKTDKEIYLNNSINMMLVDNKNLIQKWKKAYQSSHYIKKEIPVLNSFNDKYNNECSICYDNNKDNLVCFQCNHVVCKQCAESVYNLNKQCPICRKEIESKIENIYSDSINKRCLYNILCTMKLSK